MHKHLLRYHCEFLPLSPVLIAVLVRLRDTRISVSSGQHSNALDNRRLEIVADGLPLFLGAQLAVDTTLVSVLRRDGTPRPRCANEDGAALVAARRRKEGTYPELTGRDGRTRLVVLACEVGGRWSEEGQDFVRSLAKGQRRATALEGPSSSSLAVEVGDLAGVQCCEGLRTFSARATRRFGCGWRHSLLFRSDP